MWGFVQSIKRPALLEIWGPLFMSTAATSNLMYRLTEVEGGSLITFTHTVVGPFPEDHRLARVLLAAAMATVPLRAVAQPTDTVGTRPAGMSGASDDASALKE